MNICQQIHPMHMHKYAAIQYQLAVSTDKWVCPREQTYKLKTNSMGKCRTRKQNIGQETDLKNVIIQ